MIYEYAEGTYSNRGIVLRPDTMANESHLMNVVGKAANHSYFAMDATAADYMREHGAMNGRYGGLYYLPWLILDFDGKSDIDVVLYEASTFIRYLLDTLNVPEEGIQLWYSGKKGFHVYIAGSLFGFTPSNHLPSDVKATVEKHFAHPLVDMVPINRAGMIRHPYSRHPDTGHQKVPIPLKRLFGMRLEEVVDTLTRPVKPNVALIRPPEFAPLLAHLVEHGWHFNAEEQSLSVSVAKHDPTRMVTCMQKLFVRGPKRGRRHQDLLRLGSWLWRSGVPEEAAMRVLEGWMDHGELQRMVRSSYEKGYSYGCGDSVMSEYCDKKCVFAKNRDYSMDIKSGGHLLSSVKEHIRLVRQGRGISVTKLYGASGDYEIYPSELAIVAADTGIGKSLFVQDFINRTGAKTLYLNLEMPEYLVVRRFLQNRFSLSKKEIAERFVRDEVDGFAEVLENIMMVSTAPTIESIEQSVVRFRPEILVIDTTDGISVPEAGNSDMWHMKKVVDGLRSIVQKYNIIGIAIHHLSKTGSRAINGTGMENRRAMSLDDLTGRRDNVTKMDHVWAIEGDRKQAIRTVRSMKERDNGGFEIKLHFDFEVMQVRPATPIEETAQPWAV